MFELKTTVHKIRFLAVKFEFSCPYSRPNQNETQYSKSVTKKASNFDGLFFFIF